MNDSLSASENVELRKLIKALQNEEITPEEAARLEQWVCRNDQARWIYVQYMNLFAGLHWDKSHDPDLTQSALDEVQLPRTPVLGFLSDALGHGISYLNRPTPFWTLISAVVLLPLTALIVVVMLSSTHEPIAGTHVPIAGRHEPIAGTHVVDVPAAAAEVAQTYECIWEGAERDVAAGMLLAAGEKLCLVEGLAELKFADGTKVILQGPATFDISDGSRGFLHDGSLVAKVPKQAIGFTIDTPAVRVVDLGTEFGVDVDHQGVTTSHVFRGSIRIETPEADKNISENAIVLHKGDSARSRIAENEKNVIHLTAVEPVKYIRRLPRRIPIEIYSTGIGQKEGENDAHWEVIANSNDPKFDPQPAFIEPQINHIWLANDSESKWITLDKIPQPDASYTFRTTFDLSGSHATTAMLRGEFLADDRVRVIRLNGQDIYRSQSIIREQHPSKSFIAFTADSGFVDRINTLEFDVENYTIEGPARSNYMGLRVKIQASAFAKEGM